MPRDSERIGVLHVTDTLEAGGMERVAVNLVNALPRDRYRLHLCTTRRDGPLASAVASDVGRLRLGRRRTLDPGAWSAFRRYVRQNEIRIVHAHGQSLFLARLASLFSRDARLVWHDHYGAYAVQSRPAWLYRAATRGVAHVVAVNEPLAQWSVERLGMSPERVSYVPNPTATAGPAASTGPELPGEPGSRIACVANLRPQKDHRTLLRAMARVVARHPRAHLLLVGGGSDPAYRAVLEAERSRLRVDDAVTFLGTRADVPQILRACAVGVLSSASEGFPLAILDYAAAGLATVATRIGQCPQLLDSGRAGILADVGDDAGLAEALTTLLDSPSRRAELGSRLSAHVRALCDPEEVIASLCRIYDRALGLPPRSARPELVRRAGAS